MKKRTILAAAALLLALPLAAQQQPDSRDINTVGPATKNAPVTIPRSYALVIGISTYQNLPASAQLEFPNRDAEDMYTTLISAEGGRRQHPPRAGGLAALRHQGRRPRADLLCRPRLHLRG